MSYDVINLISIDEQAFDTDEGIFSFQATTDEGERVEVCLPFSEVLRLTDAWNGAVDRFRQ